VEVVFIIIIFLFLVLLILAICYESGELLVLEAHPEARGGGEGRRDYIWPNRVLLKSD
jgi:hypothetical protein